MKRSLRLAGIAGMAVLAASVVVSSAFAQNEGGRGRGRGGRGGGGGFGFGGGGGPSAIGLVGNEAVQKELGLSEEQTKKLETLTEDYRAEMRDEMQSIGGGFDPGASPEERQERMEKMQKAMAKVNDEFKPKLMEIVSTDQMKRLDEISLQARGSAALTDEETAKALALTDDQKKKLGEVSEEFANKTRELFSGGPGSFNDETREKMQTLGKEREDASLAVLTQEQKDKLAQMKGKEFDVAQLRRGFGGGGRGPGGGGGRPGGGDRPQRPGADSN